MSEAAPPAHQGDSAHPAANPVAAVRFTREVWLFLGRVLVGTVLIFGAYAMMPTGKDKQWWGAIPVTVLCLFLFVAAFIIQIRRVPNAKYPIMRALETLVYSLLTFMVLFAAIAVQLDNITPGSYTEPLDKIAGFYFSVTTLATVGYGDITPVTNTARVVCTIQMLGNLVLLGVALRLLGHEVEGRVRSAREARAAPAGKPSAS